MSALKSLSFFVMLFVVIAGCGSNETADLVKEKDEQLPKVDASKFRVVKKEGFEISILKKMSVNNTSGDLIFSADYLPDEYHLDVYSLPQSRFENDAQFPSKKEKRLEWFAHQYAEKLEGQMKSLNQEPMQEVISNKQECFKQTLRGREYGFPVNKTYFLRHYQIGGNFIAIVAWTTHFNADKFEKLAQYMGMKFQAID